jgi:nitronate monooxygenase
MKPCSRNCFGLGWPDAPHRVIPNAATRRWIGQADRGHLWIRKANHGLATVMPPAAQNRALKAQPPWIPILVALPPTDDGPESLVDWRPLYAGASVTLIAEFYSAAKLVSMLTQ